MPSHEGYEDAVNLTISLCLTYTLCIACVRIWIRKGSFGLDDLVVAIATAITLGNTAASYASLAEGMGIKWYEIVESGKVASLNKASIAGIITFLVALYLSKCAMLFFLCRITKTPSQLRLYRACNVIIAVLGILSILVAVAGCSTPSRYYWAFHANKSSCPSQAIRWQAITGLDIITEAILLTLPVHLVWGLQMAMTKKAMILAAFYLRVPVIGFSIGRNYYTLKLRLPHADPGLDSALVVIWLEVELAYALAASTLLALKAFTESFSSGFGLAFTRGKGEGSYGLSNVSGNSGGSSKTEKPKDPRTLESAAGASRMGSIGPQTPAKDDIEILVSPVTPTMDSSHESQLKLRPETQLRTITQVSAKPSFDDFGCRLDNSSASSHSSGGDDMVIIRETAYDVHHDEAPMLRNNSYHEV